MLNGSQTQNLMPTKRGLYSRNRIVLPRRKSLTYQVVTTPSVYQFTGVDWKYTGPGTYAADVKVPAAKNAAGTRVAYGDRYAALQRKLEDLERVHAESKKAVSIS